VCECQSNGIVTYGDDIKLVRPHKLGIIFEGVSTFGSDDVQMAALLLKHVARVTKYHTAVVSDSNIRFYCESLNTQRG